MGVEDNNFQIEELTSNTSFFEWASKTNTDIIGKLNRLKVYDGISGDGINVVVGVTSDSAGFTPTGVSAGDILVELSGNVSKGMTFNDVSINGTLTYDFSAAFAGVKTVSLGISGHNTGITGGDIVRYEESIGGVTLAKADSATNAEVLGIVLGERGTNEISVATHGFVDLGGFNESNGGLSAGCIHFLDPLNPGRLTKDEPNVIGQVSKPVFLATSSTGGVFYNYRGQLLAGTGGTGDTNADNNAFFLTTAQVPSAILAGFTVGKVIAYDGSSYTLAKANTESSLNSIVGVVTAVPSSSPLTVKIVTSGYVVESPTNSVGPLYVNDNGDLTSTFTGSPVVAVGVSRGSDSAIVINPMLGQISGSSSTTSGVGQQYARNAIPNVGGLTASTGGVSYVNQNLLPNGSMTIWQRGVGVGSAHLGTGPTYFADRWVRLNRTNVDHVGVTGSGTLSIERKEFAITQTEVEGNPLYYTRLNNSIPGNTYDDIIHVEHRIEGADSFRGENMTLGFYAKAANSGQTAEVFIKQNYNGLNTETKTELGAIEFGTSWKKYITVFGVPEMDNTPNANLPHYFATGLDLTKVSGNIDLAQFKLERGISSTPVEPRTIEDEYELCARYYQRSYAPDIATLTNTTINNIPDATSINFVDLPNSNDHTVRFPVRMRGTPEVLEFYSPFSGETGDAYNATAQNDLKDTGGSVGHNLQVRSGSLGSSLSKTNVTKDGFIIETTSGVVDFDKISVHYVADADLNNNIPGMPSQS